MNTNLENSEERVAFLKQCRQLDTLAARKKNKLRSCRFVRKLKTVLKWR